MRSLSEILSTIDALPTEALRVEALQQIPAQYSRPLQTLLQHTFDKKIKYRLPEGEIEYEKSTLDNPGVLLAETSRLYLFREDSAMNVRDEKLLFIFKNMLSMMIPADAELLIGVKNKKLPYKNITRKVVTKAFPGLI